jgi:hypothetical protein
MTLVNVRRHLRLVMTACIAMALLFVVAPPPAGAQTGTSLKLVEIDSTDATNVHVVFRYSGASSDVNGLAVTEDGKPVDAADPKPITEAGKVPGVVFVLDTSGSTDAAEVGEGHAGRTRVRRHRCLPRPTVHVRHEPHHQGTRLVESAR